MEQTAKDIKHVAMYLRISQEKKGENTDTLQNHREYLTDYAVNNKYTFDEYSEVLSGGLTELEERPKLQGLLENIEKYDAILVMEPSRLSRNGKIAETILQHCVDYDKPIITPEKIYDPNNSSDIMQFKFGHIIASDEHKRIGQRSKNNKITMAKQGQFVSGAVPWGYVRNETTKRLEIVEEQAETIRYIFKLQSEGNGCHKIRDILNSEGYLSQKGNPFSLTTISKIIRNPAYKGTVEFNDRKKVKENGKYRYKTIETITVDNAHPAIVSPQEWEKANNLRESRKTSFNFREKPTTKESPTILKDLLYCGNCGRKLRISKDSRLNEYYVRGCNHLLHGSAEKCGNSGIAVKHLEDTVKEQLESYQSEVKEQLSQLMEADLSGVINELENQRNSIDRQIEEQERNHNKLIDLALQDIFSNEEIKERKQSIENKLEDLRNQRETVESRIKEANVEETSKRLREVVEILENLFETTDTTTQNEHLKRIIKAIYFKRQIPQEIKALSPQNPERKNYPSTIEIEYL